MNTDIYSSNKISDSSDSVKIEMLEPKELTTPNEMGTIYELPYIIYQDDLKSRVYSFRFSISDSDKGRVKRGALQSLLFVKARNYIQKNIKKGIIPPPIIISIQDFSSDMQQAVPKLFFVKTERKLNLQ